MTEAHPMLTDSNVKYWYWEVEPHWSGYDIAKAVGCGITTLYRFMKTHKIQIRSKSEANINRFNCPYKYKRFVKQRQTPEFRRQQSIVTSEVMKRLEVRKKISDAVKKASLKIFSTFQKAILLLLYSHEGLFLTDFGRMIELKKEKLDIKLRKLYNRGYVDRVKSYNNNGLNHYKSHYKYSLTRRGRELVSNGLKDGSFNLGEFKQIFRPVEIEKKMTINEFLQKENIGPNQLIVLKTIQKSGPKFLVELASQLQIPKTAIDRSLWALSSRGFIKREKKINQKYSGSINCRKQFLYSITDKCPALTDSV
ncbi:hypothetical protein LCGC14_0800820 [marine sediment metagenome]|uniref:Uncharacterized protein n=1 Tax=marine sediment metagenome TaxID=412755 RepID=A0A0F9S9P1_9ZZZZ